MSTATEERTDLVELVVDLDADVVCNAPAGCERVAEWVYYCPGCRDVWLACSWHRMRQDQHLATNPPFISPACSKCEADLPRVIPWRPL